VKRTKVISSMRRAMEDIGFTEYSTPILTASSPEGARDFLVPSRIHPAPSSRCRRRRSSISNC
jgi:aspartyl-tRNA synthetase